MLDRIIASQWLKDLIGTERSAGKVGVLAASRPAADEERDWSWRAVMLDRIVAVERVKRNGASGEATGRSKPVMFELVVPHPEPQDGAALLATCAPSSNAI